MVFNWKFRFVLDFFLQEKPPFMALWTPDILVDNWTPFVEEHFPVEFHFYQLYIYMYMHMFKYLKVSLGMIYIVLKWITSSRFLLTCFVYNACLIPLIPFWNYLQENDSKLLFSSTTLACICQIYFQLLIIRCLYRYTTKIKFLFNKVIIAGDVKRDRCLT